MKKLYRKGRVHPSHISDHLTFLPAAILTLAAALSPEDREVLAYLISSSVINQTQQTHNKITNTNKATISTTAGGRKGGDHPPSFNCNCFRCYTSYWARWDSSPNRQLIHEIIDAFEDGVIAQSKRSEKSKRERRRRRGFKGNELNRSDQVSSSKEEFGESCLVEVTTSGEAEEGSVRKFVSFIGERFWSVWTLGKKKVGLFPLWF